MGTYVSTQKQEVVGSVAELSPVDVAPDDSTVVEQMTFC